MKLPDHSWTRRIDLSFQERVQSIDNVEPAGSTNSNFVAFIGPGLKSGWPSVLFGMINPSPARVLAAS